MQGECHEWVTGRIGGIREIREIREISAGHPLTPLMPLMPLMLQKKSEENSPLFSSKLSTPFYSFTQRTWKPLARRAECDGKNLLIVRVVVKSK